MFHILQVKLLVPNGKSPGGNFLGGNFPKREIFRGQGFLLIGGFSLERDFTQENFPWANFLGGSFPEATQINSEGKIFFTIKFMNLEGNSGKQTILENPEFTFS